MMTNKPKKPEKVDTIVGQMKGVPSSTSEQLFSPALLKDIRQLIEGARARAAAAVNSEMVGLYWSIGERIRKDILAFERAAYGEQIVNALSRQLGGEYGRGFSRPNLVSPLRQRGSACRANMNMPLVPMMSPESTGFQSLTS